jgi:type IV fimbrial biogenesis protein FimT
MKKEHGFNLIELMVAVSVAGVLIAVALPNYQTMVKNNCMTANTNSLVASFQQARSEAIKRKTNVTITATTNWGTGWTVTLDEDRNDNSTLDTGEDYDGDGALDNAALVRTVTLTCVNTTITETRAGDTTFVYQNDGFIDDRGVFDVCDDRTAERGRQISISSTGRPTTNSNYNGCT